MNTLNDMEREIKFRAWDNGAKKWLLGYEYPNLGGFSLFGEIMLMSEWSQILNAYILNREAYNHNEGDLIVMQFTGLKDKNGKEVFEGDILQWTSSNPFSIGEIRKVKVEYVEARFWCTGTIGVYLAELLSAEKCEVIGNIYENPEYLK
jgi:uncharacterized phage protein (TIGR01671 family)